MALYSPSQFPAINGLVKNLKIEMFENATANVPSGEYISKKLKWLETRVCQPLIIIVHD